MHKNVQGKGRQPFFFGPPELPLFGCYHEPQSDAVRSCGIVLCYPMGQEYIRSHRTYLQLAVRLSNIGFPVLRFDFSGCGDSAGDCEQGRIAQWVSDISTAIGELRQRCNMMRVGLIGLRLGATLAMIAGAKRADIDAMVLWNPVVSGKAYVEELRALQKEMLKHSYVKQNGATLREEPTEILGFPFKDFLRDDLRQIDLLAIRQKPAGNILLMESNEEVTLRPLRDHLGRCGAEPDYRQVRGPRIWLEEPFKVLIPAQVLQSVVSWVSQVYP